jgi:SnoaL-like polyketide cyclase
VEHQFGLAATGEQAREHVRAAIRDVLGAFPDISFTIEDFAEHGDKIWVRVQARGGRRALILLLRISVRPAVP